MADLASSPYFLLILFIAAFALPLLYLIWIRNWNRNLSNQSVKSKSSYLLKHLPERIES